MYACNIYDYDYVPIAGEHLGRLAPLEKKITKREINRKREGIGQARIHPPLFTFLMRHGPQ